MNMDLQTTLKTRRLYLAEGFIGMLFVGIIYGWSILKVPFTKEFSWNPSTLTAVYTVSIGCYCLGNILAAFTTKKIKIRPILLTAAGLILIGFLLTSFQGYSIITLFLSYGVCVGLGIGIAYNVFLSTVNSWFPDKKGFASGILMMGFGISVLVFGRVLSEAFESTNWRIVIRVFAVSIFTVLVLIAVLLRAPHKDDEIPTVKSKLNRPGIQNNFSFVETIRRPSYWLFFAYGISGAAIGSSSIGLAREIAASFGATAALAATLAGVLSVFNGLGRIIWGLTFDALGYRKTMFMASLITVAAPAVMLLASINTNLYIGIIGLGLAGISYSSIPVISSVFISSAYGPRDFPLNYGLSNTKVLFSSLSSIACSSLIASTGSCNAAFILLLILAAISMGLCLCIRNP